MGNAQIVLEYLKVLLTWPVIAGIIALSVLRNYRDPLKGLIARVASVKLPGGGEFTAHQFPATPADTAVPPLPTAAATTAVALPPTLNDAERLAVKELFDAERARAYLWEYRYLNRFLAPVTQEVLDWLGGLEMRASRAMADTLWATRIPDPEQRNLIFTILDSHHLIEKEGELFKLSPKGREYLEWRGKV